MSGKKFWSGLTAFAVVVLSLLVLGTPVTAAPATFQWGSIDSGGATTAGVYDTDNSTILQTGDLAQLIWVGGNGTIDAPQANGAPGGDDQLLQVSAVDNSLAPPQQDKGYIPLTTYNYDTTDPSADGAVYIRAWNAPTAAAATAYGDSASGTLTESGIFGAPRWHTSVGVGNSDPVANDDSDTTDEDVAVTIDVLDNDTDSDGDTLEVSGVTQPTDGTVVNNTTDVTYTPDEDFNGSDSFTYTVSDGNGGTDTATVNVTVDPVNDDPDAVDDSDTTSEETAVTIDVLDNDTDVENDTLEITAVTQPADGTVVNNTTDVTYTPDENFDGEDTFTYTISDGNGGEDTATVTVTVDGENDDPVAEDDSVTTDEDTDVTIDVLDNDEDVDGDTLEITEVTQPTDGTVVNNDTDVTYTPDEDFNGEDTFTYTISDGNGGEDTATVTVTVDPVNDDPEALRNGVTIDEDTEVTIDVLANDSDVDGDELEVSEVTQPANGTVVNNTTDVTYTPDEDFNGRDTFTYTVSDGNGGEDTGTVNVTVDPVNDDPVTESDTGSTTEDTAVTIEVLTNDSDVDGDELELSAVTQPPNGTVAMFETYVIYTPDPNYYGADSFTYTVTDLNEGTDTNTVYVTISPVNDDPLAYNDNAFTDADTAVDIDVLANDSDADGDTLIVTVVVQPAYGNVVNNGTYVSYTPNSDFAGIDRFTYTVSDMHGGTDVALVTVNVGSFSLYLPVFQK